MEGLLSTGPTPSSFFDCTCVLSDWFVKASSGSDEELKYICWSTLCSSLPEIDIFPPKLGILFRMDPPKWGLLFRMVPPKVSLSICSHYISPVGDFWCFIAIMQESTKTTISNRMLCLNAAAALIIHFLQLSWLVERFHKPWLLYTKTVFYSLLTKGVSYLYCLWFFFFFFSQILPM